MSLAVICSGQGRQYPTMLNSVSGILRAEALLNLAKNMLPSMPLDLSSAKHDIFVNRIAQPLICTTILARWEAIRDELPTPSIVLGYSVGELAAHSIAGTFSNKTCIYLADCRAKFMDLLSPPDSGLTAVLGLNRKQVETICTRHNLEIAIINSETHFIVGGHLINLAAFELEAKDSGARSTRIKVNIPSHTRYLVRASNAFLAELTKADLQRPSIPVLAGINGQIIRNTDQVIDTLATQISSTVNWQQCVIQAVERGARVFLELGPGSALVKIVRELYPECKARSLDEFQSLDAAITWARRML